MQNYSDQELWQKVLSEIELQISKANFITWFKNTYISSKKGGVISIAVPNGFAKEWMEKNYNKSIFKVLRETSDEIREVRYIIENKKPTLTTNNEEIDEMEEAQLKFEEFQVDKNTNLNPRYKLNSFVVGPSNELAYATALSVIKNPGTLYNPLFIYGGVGLGKTHLLQAIGNNLSSKKNVVYLTSEKFTSEFIESALNKGVESFKTKYRSKDVLIIDDIQFIAGKEQTQENFFHTFNYLYEQNKQIILSSDRPPKAIPTLEERLRSRFEGGMLVDIGFPEYETRVAILKTKLKEKNTSIDKDILEYIAENIKRNIRELEGALNLVIAKSVLNKNNITLKETKKILSHIVDKPKKFINYKKIFKTVSDFYEIDEKELTSKNRKQVVVFPRQIAMFLMKEELKNSYPFIGEKFGGRDHTTVIHACKKIEKHLKESDTFEEELNLIIHQLYNG